MGLCEKTTKADNPVNLRFSGNLLRRRLQLTLNSRSGLLFSWSLQPGWLQRSPHGRIYGVPMKRALRPGQKMMGFKGNRIFEYKKFLFRSFPRHLIRPQIRCPRWSIRQGNDLFCYLATHLSQGLTYSRSQCFIILIRQPYDEG